jgi:hypothetical protein
LELNEAGIRAVVTRDEMAVYIARAFDRACYTIAGSGRRWQEPFGRLSANKLLPYEITRLPTWAG